VPLPRQAFTCQQTAVHVWQAEIKAPGSTGEGRADCCRLSCSLFHSRSSNRHQLSRFATSALALHLGEMVGPIRRCCTDGSRTHGAWNADKGRDRSESLAYRQLTSDGPQKQMARGQAARLNHAPSSGPVSHVMIAKAKRRGRRWRPPATFRIHP
jgi:hypothetical protein